MAIKELPSVISIPVEQLSDIGVKRVLTPDELAHILGRQRNIPPPPTTPPEAVRSGEVFKGLNEAEAKRLKMERVDIAGNKIAQELLLRILDPHASNRFDVANSDEKISKREIQRFADEWQQKVPSIPMPCAIKEGYTVYLKRLAEGNIIKNLDPKKKIPAIPNFDKPVSLWIENWQEADYTDAKVKNAVSPLLRELGVTQKDGAIASGVVNITREAVDLALWMDGDQTKKQKTNQHTALIRKLGLDPNQYNFRLIAQDEYARLAGAGKNFGKSNLWTWFNDYWVEGAAVYGLFGGHRGYGGPSNVGRVHRGGAGERLAVRLVLERNK